MSTEAEAEAEAEAVEGLLRQVLIADAQVDHDIIRPQLPLRIGSGDDAEVVPAGEVENRLISFHAEETMLDEAEASANDMIDRSQSENTKSLYAGSCNRFFSWAKTLADAATIVNLEADKSLTHLDRIKLPMEYGNAI